MPESDLTAERVRQLFSYDSDTGLLTWRMGRRAGATAGTRHSQGYVVIIVCGKPYRAHRLIWLHQYGAWPEKFIDHANGRRDDNRLVNLREASRAENNRNRRANTRGASEIKGAAWHKARRKWQAQIKVNGRNNHLGYFPTAEEAGAAYRAAAAELHGEFANFG